jgi:hypothetical protein
LLSLVARKRSFLRFYLHLQFKLLAKLLISLLQTLNNEFLLRDQILQLKNPRLDLQGAVSSFPLLLQGPPELAFRLPQLSLNLPYFLFFVCQLALCKFEFLTQLFGASLILF